MSANNVVSIDTLHEDTVGALLLMQRFSFFPTFSFFKLSFCRSIFYAILLFRFTIVSLITTPRGKAHVIALYYLISLCALACVFTHEHPSFPLTYRLATASSDKTVKIFDVTGEIYHNSATLTGHDGPVWQVSWAHPKFGVILASCSYDGSVIVYKEQPQNVWTKLFENRVHESSVNSISWAPHEMGLVLACASSDGNVSILEYRDDQW